MAKFRKRPVTIEAVQWFPGTEIEGVTFSLLDGPDPAIKFRAPVVDTLEGKMRVSPGDWIITGVKGEQYPCKPDVFAATYERVEEVPAVYLHRWSSGDDVERDFEVTLSSDIEILFASYGGGSYEGDAFLLYRQDGKLYEVNGSHCSCYGLEGQWEPEETTIAAIEDRIINGNLGHDSENRFAVKLADLLKRIKEVGTND